MDKSYNDYQHTKLKCHKNNPVYSISGQAGWTGYIWLWKMAKQKSQMAYTSISGSFDHYSDFPHSKNPESATKETLNSDVPGTYKFLLM